jgi:sterol desaturase/sphingolipid hydroxylase (fatty acid hydroxylase superfamily)
MTPETLHGLSYDAANKPKLVTAAWSLARASPQEAVMQTVSWFLQELALFLFIAVATHLVMSFAQTVMHYKLGHHPIGGKFFRNHINFHHTYYSKDHLVSPTYLGDEGNNTPFFFIPIFLVGACTCFVLPIELFVVQAVACAASFYAHVFFDKEYHVEGSRLQRFAWFRRKQELHFVHHRHANSNFAVIHFFWDRILGTYRRADTGQTEANDGPGDWRCAWLDAVRRRVDTSSGC